MEMQMTAFEVDKRLQDARNIDAGQRRPLSNMSSALDSPMFEGIDIAGLIVALCIALGPLSAYALRVGLTA
jgi:hypothetical protein